jgi:urease accessory protein
MAAAGSATPPQAALVFAADPAGKSYVARQRVAYPFHITRPFYLDTAPAGMLTVYLQSVSGGIFAGERLAVSLCAQTGARAHVTSQSPTIAHAMTAGDATQVVSIHAAEDTFVEYAPEPLILFPGARLDTRLHVTAAPGADLFLTDSFLTHDPAAAGGSFARLRGETRIEHPGGALVCLDRFDITGTALEPGSPGVDGGYRAFASVIVLGGDAAPADLGAALDRVPNIYAGASALPQNAGISARILARDGAALRAGLTAAWRTQRCRLTGVGPPIRRK